MIVQGKVLVTGATGFIGSHLTEELLREGTEVRAFAHYNSQGYAGSLEELESSLTDGLEVYFGDITDYDSVHKAMAGCEYVFHLAALVAIPYSYAHPRAFFETNVTGTLNVAQASLENGCTRMIHTSTSEVYGTAQFTPITEDHPIKCQSPYAASKAAADRVVESFHLSFGLPAVTIRPFNTYGPRQSPRAIVPTIIDQLLEGDAVRLGNLDPQRDLTYVKDTVAGFLAAAKSEGVVGETINLGTGRAVSVGELASVLIEKVRPGARVVEDPVRKRPSRSEVGVLIASFEKARSLLGWEPKTSLSEGLEAVIEYLKTAPRRGSRRTPFSYAI
ncbi:MAG: NAD-dependent dehydratase [Acidimicrobiia bacterium]